MDRVPRKAPAYALSLIHIYPVLIGEPGVGKTAIAEGLARRIVNGDVPESMRNKRIVSLNIGSMRCV